jgi:hypothetical protein
MASRTWQATLLAAAAALSLGGCRRPGSHAQGAGYGAGIAREAWSIGSGNHEGNTQGVFAPSEAGIGRIKGPPVESYPQAGRVE